MLSGIVLGPDGLKVLTNHELITQLGELGIILILFFISLEIHLPDLTRTFRKPVPGALLQVVLSGLTAWGVGNYLGWSG